MFGVSMMGNVDKDLSRRRDIRTTGTSIVKISCSGSRGHNFDLWSGLDILDPKIDHRNMTQDELINTVNLLEGRSAGQSAVDGSSDYIHIDNYEKFRKKRYIRKSTPKSHHSSHHQNDRSRSYDSHRRPYNDHRSGYSQHTSHTRQAMSDHNYF